MNFPCSFIHSFSPYWAYILVTLGFPGGSDGKESAGNERDIGLIPGLGRFPGREHGNPLQYSCLENPHGQRSLEGYSPWGCKELDETEQLSLSHWWVRISVYEWESGAKTISQTSEKPMMPVSMFYVSFQELISILLHRHTHTHMKGFYTHSF